MTIEAVTEISTKAQGTPPKKHHKLLLTLTLSLAFLKAYVWLPTNKPLKLACLNNVFSSPFGNISNLREMLQHPGTTRTVIRLKLPLNGKLVALPCSPDKLRGFHPDWIFLDEASIIPTEMITSEVIMMLTKPNVALTMSGTPMAFDHVFRKAF